MKCMYFSNGEECEKEAVGFDEKHLVEDGCEDHQGCWHLIGEPHGDNDEVCHNDSDCSKYEKEDEE